MRQDMILIIKIMYQKRKQESAFSIAEFIHEEKVDWMKITLPLEEIQLFLF